MTTISATVVDKAKALVESAGHEPEFALILLSRAALILAGDTPKVWHERPIVPREVPALLLYMREKVPMQQAAKEILRAMKDAGNLEASTQAFPETMEALKSLAVNGRP